MQLRVRRCRVPKSETLARSTRFSTRKFRTCDMVSKLKPMPFQSVNSPMLEPVNSRRPSGVHFTTLIGCLTLFKEECRSFAGMESAALWDFAEGRSIYRIGQVRIYAVWLKRGSWRSYIHLLRNLDLASPSPCVPLPCIVVADVASIVPLKMCSP